MSEPVRLTFDGQDGAISFLEWNEGGELPPLHFAHANGFNAYTYRSLLSPLASRFRIRAWDARGHGMTELAADPAQHKSWNIYRDDLIRFLDAYAQSAGEPILLAGHSMGASMSLLAAAARPDLVRGILLIEPVLLPRIFYYVLQACVKLGITGGPAALSYNTSRRRSVFADRATMAANYVGRGAFRSWPEEIIADYVAGGTKDLPDGTVELLCSPAWEAANFRAHSGDVWGAIADLKVRLTLLYASPGTLASGASSTCPPPAPQRLASRDPGATILRLGEATHFLPMEFPDEVRREILALQDRLERKSS